MCETLFAVTSRSIEQAPGTALKPIPIQKEYTCMYLYIGSKILHLDPRIYKLFMYVCMNVCMYVCMCVCVHVCLWVCMYICRCVYVSMYPRQLPTTAFNNWDSRAHASPSASVHSTKESKRNQSASRQHPTLRTTYSHSFQPKWAGHERLLKGHTFQQRISIIQRTTLTASAKFKNTMAVHHTGESLQRSTQWSDSLEAP